MKSKTIVSVLVSFFVLVNLGFSQSVTGIVYLVDEPIENAFVGILGNNTKVKTDHNGYFSIDVSGSKNLQVSFKKSKTVLGVTELSGFIDVVLVPAEKQLAKLINKTPSKQKCQTFLDTYPNSKKASQIRLKYDELSFIEAYDAAVLRDNINLLGEYVSNFPKGLYVEKASRTMDVVSWQKARSSGTREAYEAYLKKFPNGEAVRLAKDNMAMLNN